MDCRTYGVKLVRGPVVKLAPHPLACSSVDQLLGTLSSFIRPRAADIFCGAGGMSLGLQAAGFDVIVGVDHDEFSLQTHASLFPGLSLCRDLSDPGAVAEVIELLIDCDVTLVAGGPPCQPFSRAGSSKIRDLVASGIREEHDARKDLWRAWLAIVLGAKPQAVLLENVPEMALAGQMEIMRTLVGSLENAGYSVYTQILKAVEHGVPQYRQRFLLVALAERLRFEWPRTKSGIGVGDAIGDLPPVEGGWRPSDGAEGFIRYDAPSEISAMARVARLGMKGDLASRLYDHITRPVRSDDRELFQQMTAQTKYSDLADGPMKRYRDDIFDDKYKRLALEEPSRSITAHIAKDGYWYIHPTQSRTLTVREAARIQTFPDQVRFAGPPSAAFRQIGNAVPPLLASRVGRRILKSLNERSPADDSVRTVGPLLRAWFVSRSDSVYPWLESRNPWLLILGELVLGRRSKRSLSTVQTCWEFLANFDNPQKAVEGERELVTWAASLKLHVGVAVEAAEWFAKRGDSVRSEVEISANPHISKSVRQMAVLTLKSAEYEPLILNEPVMRVAARWYGDPNILNRKGTLGRLAVARMVGSPRLEGDESTETQFALLEVASRICTSRPNCGSCPLKRSCAYAQTRIAAGVLEGEISAAQQWPRRPHEDLHVPRHESGATLKSGGRDPWLHLDVESHPA